MSRWPYFIIVIFCLILIPNGAELQVVNNQFFAVYPVKQEFVLVPGEETDFYIRVINQTSDEVEFSLNVSNLISTGQSWSDIGLSERGDPFSLANFIFLDNAVLSLSSGEEGVISGRVVLSENVPPGSLEGAVVVSSQASGEGEAIAISQIASLLFVRVPGDLIEDGRVLKFDTIGSNFKNQSQPLSFQVVFSNSGNTYLNPYGLIAIKNMWGREVEVLPIDPWFVLPNSLRTRELLLDTSSLGGFYRAELVLNRGYEDILEEHTLWFFVWSWKLIALLLFLVLVFVFMLKYIYRKNA